MGDLTDDEFIKWGHGQPAGDDQAPPESHGSREELAADATYAAERTAPIATPPGQQHELLPQGGPHDQRGRAPIARNVAFVAVLLLVGVLGVAFGLTRNSGGSAQPGVAVVRIKPSTSSPSTTLPSPSAVAPAASPSAKARPTTDPGLEQLQALVKGDATLAARKLDGRWVAMLASKTDGIPDPLQTTASGSHTFGWSDILREHERLRQDPRFGSEVFLILSTSFGRAVTRDGKPLYVTAADIGFTDAADVRSWCESTFANLHKAQRDNACSPAQMSPPS